MGGAHRGLAEASPAKSHADVSGAEQLPKRGYTCESCFVVGIVGIVALVLLLVVVVMSQQKKSRNSTAPVPSNSAAGWAVSVASENNSMEAR